MALYASIWLWVNAANDGYENTYDMQPFYMTLVMEILAKVVG